MKYVILCLLLLSGCATVDCRDKDWQDSCACNRDQFKCERRHFGAGDRR